MAKLEKKSKVITPFAGVFFIDEEFNRIGLGKLIDNELGVRGNGFGYTHSEIFRSWFNVRVPDL